MRKTCKTYLNLQLAYTLRYNPPTGAAHLTRGEKRPMPNKTPKYHTTANGNRYGTRIRLFSLLYVPRKGDTDVIEFLLRMRAHGENITQLITDAIRLLMENKK